MSHLRLTAVTVLAAALLALAGCGGSSDRPAPGTDVAAAGSTPSSGGSTPSAPAAKHDGNHRAKGQGGGSSAGAQSVVAGTGTVTKTRHSVKARPPAEGTDDDESSPSGTDGLDPCKLVSRSEAGTIMRTRVAAPVTAPQGPTCIYQGRRSKQAVTLAVQSQSLSAVLRHGRSLARVTVHGRAGRCVKYGAVAMYVPLDADRVLNVTAPCTVAARFAAKAVPRLLR